MLRQLGREVAQPRQGIGHRPLRVDRDDYRHQTRSQSKYMRCRFALERRVLKYVLLAIAITT
jgi:hypothetical protein